ncbi:MAG TPA: hypothetical protein VHL80_04705, partial [Polyangia bacterium]|nr:hypothetical protein [Polyangia bacterium]
MLVGAAALARTALGLALVAAAAPAGAPPEGAAARPESEGHGPFDAELASASATLEARRGRPEAIAPLAQLLALEDALPPRALEPALRRAAAAGNHPLVAAQAALHLAHLLDEAGDADGARAARASLGLFSRFAVVGPFGEGRAGFSQVFPPEHEAAAPEAGRTYRGRLGDVRWRAGDALVREGALVLDGMLRPDTQATAYVVVFARSGRDQEVALRLGTPGPVKVWVDGALVLARDVVRTAALDQDAAPARLRAGWNRIVVKTTVTDEPWRLYLRATDPAGRALALGDGALPAGEKVATRGPAGRSARAVETLEADLRRRAAAAPAGEAGADAWLDLGRYLAWAEPGDREAREAQAALETARARRPTIDTLRLLADVARDEDERRRALDAAAT